MSSDEAEPSPPLSPCGITGATGPASPISTDLVATPEGVGCVHCGARVGFGHAYLISFVDGRPSRCSECPGVQTTPQNIVPFTNPPDVARGSTSSWVHSPADVNARVPEPIFTTIPLRGFVTIKPESKKPDTDAPRELEHALGALSDRWARKTGSGAAECFAVHKKLEARSELAAAAFLRAFRHMAFHALDSGHPEFLALLGDLARFDLKVLLLGCP